MDLCKDAAAAPPPDKYSFSIVLWWCICWRVGAPSSCWFNRICEVIIDHVGDARANYCNATRPVLAKRRSETMARNRQTTTTAFSLLGDRISKRDVVQFIKWDAFSVHAPCARRAVGALHKENKSTYKLNNGTVSTNGNICRTPDKADKLTPFNLV